MDALEALFTRRSIRKYDKRQLPEASLQQILKAAMLSPSALDERPWHFVLIEQRQLLDSLGTEMEGCEMLQEAGAALLICGDESLEQIKGMGFWVQDCSACTENILIAAHALGLGAVWLAVFPMQDRTARLRELLDIPDSIIPFSLVSLGFPAEKLGEENRFDPSRVHKNRWSK